MSADPSGQDFYGPPRCQVGAPGCTHDVDLVKTQHIVPSNTTWPEFDVHKCVSCLVQEAMWELEPSDDD